MAFENKVTNRTVMGNKRVHMGTYTNNGGSTGGDINTGLRSCEHINLQPNGSAVVASAPVVNETLPVDGSAVTVVNTADESGTWMAVGY